MKLPSDCLGLLFYESTREPAPALPGGRVSLSARNLAALGIQSHDFADFTSAGQLSTRPVLAALGQVPGQSSGQLPGQ
jgi:hypothetical protein